MIIAQQDDIHQSQTTGTPLAKTDISCRSYVTQNISLLVLMNSYNNNTGSVRIT